MFSGFWSFLMKEVISIEAAKSSGPVSAQKVNYIWEVRNLGYSFQGQDRPVLEGLSFKIEPGRWVVVFGLNGSGKSTLLKMMAGLYPSRQGEILYMNKDLNCWDKGEFHQTVAWLGQNISNQLVTTSVEEEIAFGLENLGVDVKIIRQKVNEALREWQLDPYRDHPPHLLSGGQQKKLALAGILVMEPQTILADEPFTFVDESIRREVVQKFTKLKENGTTIFMTTPNIMDIIHADWVIILKEGRLAWQGTPDEFIEEKENWRKMSVISPPAVGDWIASG